MLLKVIQFYTPEFIKKKELSELFRLTAEAFQDELPDLRGLSFGECLVKYAMYTREQAETYLASGRNPQDVKYRLYQKSCVLGHKLRKSIHLVTWEEALKALQAVYKLIGIDLHYDKQGGIIIKECFFSRYYTAEVCKLISSLDEGLASGLSNGGSLSFQERITEGYSCCKGNFSRGL